MAKFYRTGGFVDKETEATDPKASEVRMTIDEYRELLQMTKDLQNRLNTELRRSQNISDAYDKQSRKYKAELGEAEHRIEEMQREMETEQAGKIWITEQEYNGLQKALRIVRDRACQQIDKAKADEHGYTLQSANLRTYNRKKQLEAWMIKKSTPYSINIPAEEAKAMIVKDLMDFYGYYEKPVLTYHDHFAGDLKHRVNDEELLIIALTDDSIREPYESELQDWWESLDSHSIIIKVAGLSANYGKGVYEVSYWATDLI